MLGRFNPDQGPRGGSAMGGAPSYTPTSQQNSGVASSAIPGNPHSSRGFKRALMKTERSAGRLKDQLPRKESFSGPGYKKPNYFGQGGRRHGMHMGAGAPVIQPAADASDMSF